MRTGRRPPKPPFWLLHFPSTRATLNPFGHGCPVNFDRHGMHLPTRRKFGGGSTWLRAAAKGRRPGLIPARPTYSSATPRSFAQGTISQSGRVFSVTGRSEGARRKNACGTRLRKPLAKGAKETAIAEARRVCGSSGAGDPPKSEHGNSARESPGAGVVGGRSGQQYTYYRGV